MKLSTDTIQILAAAFLAADAILIIGLIARAIY